MNERAVHHPPVRMPVSEQRQRDGLTRDPQLVDTGFDGGGFEGCAAGDQGQQAAKQDFAGVLVDVDAGGEELVLQPCPEETGWDGADHLSHGALAAGRRRDMVWKRRRQRWQRLVHI